MSTVLGAGADMDLDASYSVIGLMGMVGRVYELSPFKEMGVTPARCLGTAGVTVLPQAQPAQKGLGLSWATRTLGCLGATPACRGLSDRREARQLVQPRR